MIIMHIDANSAYLSWSAAALLERGSATDLRTIPSVVGGTQATRHGIVLTKSIPAKAYGIKTGESLMEAKQKCPGLTVVHPDYDLYMLCSNGMYDILSRYSDVIQRYSIDECFLDYTRSERRFGDPVAAAFRIKEDIKKELGFTVNVGVSTNKLLAKMGSELKKPDMVHTLFPEEIKEKMWPLPVSELFMVGKATTDKLNKMGIRTIGELANSNPDGIRAAFKTHGNVIWRYANGLDDEPVTPNSRIVQKGVGNSMTIHYDVTSRMEAHEYILSLTERVASRLRSLSCLASLVSVWIKTSTFSGYGHQRQLQSYTDSTMEIYKTACALFDEAWQGEPIRQLGIGASKLVYGQQFQLSVFDDGSSEINRKADEAIDSIRSRYGNRAVMRGVFANSGINPMEGGVNDGNFLTMGGYGL